MTASMELGAFRMERLSRYPMSTLVEWMGVGSNQIRWFDFLPGELSVCLRLPRANGVWRKAPIWTGGPARL